MRGWRKKPKTLLINLSIVLMWLILVWLSYVLFPNQLGPRRIVSRIVLIGIAVQLLVLASQQRHRILNIVKEFFTGESHPVNLAVFRIVLFATLFNAVDVSRIALFSRLPAELQVAPRGLEWFFDYLPINETLARIACTLLLASSFTAMIGLFSRTSALLCVIFGFYALGIPQFFGKVGHSSHHFLWFAAILAASRCGDFFSCDAIFAAWKRADRGIVEPSSSSRAYALPLRFVWLLIGIIYLFPGLWKFWRSGFDWALSENFKFTLYNKWLELGGWLPLFRLDHYPLLYKLSALGAIVFEVSFIFLIFFPRLRVLTALVGCMFHYGIYLLMRITFWNLLACYVAFFDWNAIFNHTGRWFYRQEMYVLYDGNCQLCRRTIASLRVFDILGRLTYVNALDQEALAKHGLTWLESTTLLTDMHAVVQNKTWTGFSAYRVIATRIPILWPILPLLYVWPVPIIGKRIYRRVADSRTCSVANVPLLKTVERQYTLQPRLQAVMTVGIFILFINSFLGIKGETYSWPFSCYPTFAGIADSQQESLEIVPLSSTGKTIAWDEQAIKQKFSSDPSGAASKFTQGLMSQIKTEKDFEQRRIRLQALWQVMVQNESALRQADSVQFYNVTLWNIPEKQNENPISQELIYELKL